MPGTPGPPIRSLTTCKIGDVDTAISGFFRALTTTTLVNVHRGAVLPEGRFVVLAVPLGALVFYLLVVRRRRDS